MDSEGSQKDDSSARSPGPLLLCLLAVCVLGGLAVAWRRGRGNQVANVGLLVPPKALDLGEVWARSDHGYILPITNSNSYPVKIESISASCVCTAIEPQSLVIGPGQKAEVRLTIDLASQIFEARTSVPQKDFSVQVVATVDRSDKTEYARWQIRGKIRNAVGLSTPLVDLQDRMVRGSPWPTISCPIIFFEPLFDLRVDCDARYAQVAVKDMSENKRTCTLCLTLNADLPVGPLEFPVYLSPVIAGHKLPPVRAIVKGTVVDDIYATPQGFALGILREGQHLEAEVVMASRQGRAFEIKKIETSAPTFRAALDGGGDSTEAPRIRLTSESLPPGKVLASVTVSAVQTITGQEMRVIVPVTGYVLPSSGSNNRKDSLGHPAAIGKGSKECK